MSAGAPQDPQFYVDLIKFGQRTGVRPEDALYIWTSETGLDNAMSLPGSRTFSALMHYIAVPNVMSEAIWQRMPSLSHREQLPYVESAVFTPAHRMIGGRPFNSTFEVYLANAAPGLLRTDGRYSDATPMYIGSNYPDNWTMDNFPAASGKGGSSLRGNYDVALSLIDQGVLKGYVSLGDLRNFAKRLTSSTSSSDVFHQAVQKLNATRSAAPHVAGFSNEFEFAGFTSSSPPMRLPLPSSSSSNDPGSPTPQALRGYTPDFDSSFTANAPPDTRIATVAAARAATPKSASSSGSSNGASFLPDLSTSRGKWILGGVAIGGILLVVVVAGTKTSSKR